MTIFKSDLDFSLDGQIILVTGATGHLGQELCKGIAHKGGILVLCGRNDNKLNDLARDIRAKGRDVSIICCDLMTENACELIIEKIKKQFGKLNGIVNNAHFGRSGTMRTSQIKDFENAHKIHVSVPFFLVQSALDLLIKAANSAQGASIVNVASMYGGVSPDPRIYGQSGNNNPPYYGAAKAGMIQLTRYMACHLGEYNIRVNSVSPGPFPPSSIKEEQPDFYNYLCAKNPMGRIGSAQEITGSIVFLLSKASSFVTGANLAIDGGWTAW